MSTHKFEPPTYLFIFLLLAVALHYSVPIAGIVKLPYTYSGLVLIVLGLGLNIWADNLFKKKKTTVKPNEIPLYFIADGPFRFSRNPMYLGMVVLLLGVAVVLGSLTSFFGPIAFLIAMETLFIPEEEKAMTKVFGEKYRNYKKRVRCWI